MAPPTLDKAGNVYGTTYGGGGNISNCLAELEGCGTVFKLTKSGNGWTERVLHTFEGTDGAELNSPVLLVGHTIYGPTTAEGPEEGSQYSFGTVFQIN
jgi:hypothetical protein